MTLGEKIKLERKRQGMTQAEFASRVGVSRQVIVEYEKDNMKPRGLDRYRKIAEVLNVSVEYLISGKSYYSENAIKDDLSSSSKQSKKLIEQAAMLFSGGELSEVDKDTLMMALQDAYWEARRKRKD